MGMKQAGQKAEAVVADGQRRGNGQALRQVAKQMLIGGAPGLERSLGRGRVAVDLVVFVLVIEGHTIVL